MTELRLIVHLKNSSDTLIFRIIIAAAQLHSLDALEVTEHGVEVYFKSADWVL